MFPGCTDPPEWTERHHIVAWRDGGATDIDNLCLLCDFHHDRIDTEGWAVTMRDGVPWFTPPDWIDPTEPRNATNTPEPSLAWIRPERTSGKPADQPPAAAAVAVDADVVVVTGVEVDVAPELVTAPEFEAVVLKVDDAVAAELLGGAEVVGLALLLADDRLGVAEGLDVALLAVETTSLFPVLAELVSAAGDAAVLPGRVGATVGVGAGVPDFDPLLTMR